MRQVNQIVIASTNFDKVQEFQDLFGPQSGIKVLSAAEALRNPEKLGFVEKFDTYAENAAAKARLANQGSHYPSLGDDTGLEVRALEGKPGVRSHRYAVVKDAAGNPVRAPSRLDQYAANNALLLEELRGKTDRTARFVTSLALCIEGILVVGNGSLEGTIVDSPRGNQGFGYDALFLPNGSSKTLGEMSLQEKNALSHRTKAFQDLMLQLKARGIVLAKP